MFCVVISLTFILHWKEITQYIKKKKQTQIRTEKKITEVISCIF